MSIRSKRSQPYFLVIAIIFLLELSSCKNDEAARNYGGSTWRISLEDIYHGIIEGNEDEPAFPYDIYVNFEGEFKIPEQTNRDESYVTSIQPISNFTNVQTIADFGEIPPFLAGIKFSCRGQYISELSGTYFHNYPEFDFPGPYSSPSMPYDQGDISHSVLSLLIGPATADVIIYDDTGSITTQKIYNECGFIYLPPYFIYYKGEVSNRTLNWYYDFDPDTEVVHLQLECLSGCSPNPARPTEEQCDDQNLCTRDTFVSGEGCAYEALNGSFDFNHHDCFVNECQNGYRMDTPDNSAVPPQASPNDCEKNICVAGLQQTVADLSEKPPLESNNCNQEVCGPYGIEYRVDNTDEPLQDSPNDCLRQVCQLGGPISVPDDSETPLPDTDGTPRICQNGEAVSAP